MPDDIQVAIIGAGRHGRDLTNYALDIPGVRFRAVCDIWPYAQRYAAALLKRRGHPVNAYEDHREMLAREKDLQAAIIATPDSFHAEQAVACLDAGLHVFLEKEMHNTIEGARQVVQAARRTRKLCQVGRQHRSNPRYHLALKYIDQNKALGRITNVWGQWHGHKRIKYTWPEKETLDPAVLARYGYESMEQLKNWRYFERFSGGEIANLGSHQIDVFNWFLHARPKAVYASGGLDTIKMYQWYDNVVCIFEWDYTWEGQTHTVRGGYRILNTLEHEGFFEVFYGDEATMEISETNSVGLIKHENSVKDAELLAKAVPIIGASDLVEQVPKLRDAPKAPWLWSKQPGEFRWTPLPPVTDKPVHWYHLKNFFDAVRGEAKLTCPAEVGFEACVSALKVNEAMKLGGRLDLTPEDFAVL
jgi:predicted dehydrogenase